MRARRSAAFYAEVTAAHYDRLADEAGVVADSREIDGDLAGADVIRAIEAEWRCSAEQARADAEHFRDQKWFGEEPRD